LDYNVNMPSPEGKPTLSEEAKDNLRIEYLRIFNSSVEELASKMLEADEISQEKYREIIDMASTQVEHFSTRPEDDAASLVQGFSTKVN